MQLSLKHYFRLMRLDKPIGIYLCLWPCLWVIPLGPANPDVFWILGIVILGSILVRSLGCVINDIIDRHIDPHVTRTQHRPLANGDISLKEAWAVFAVLAVLASSLLLLLNTLAVTIALFTGLLTLLYPYAKRLTYFPQIILGIVFNAGVLITYAAYHNTLPGFVWLVYLSAIGWTVAFDTIYAMSDREDDKKISIKSTAIYFEKHDLLFISGMQITMLVLLALVGYQAHRLLPFYLALLIAGLFFLYQHYLVQQSTSSAYIKAFRNNHWVGMVIFIGIVCSA